MIATLFAKERLRRIKSLILQEIYITKGSIEILVDIFWFPVMTVLAVGFIDQYFSSQTGSTHVVTAGYLYWEYFRIVQYTIAVGIMWNIWSHNLSNIFITGLTMKEYFLTKFFLAVVVSCLSFTFNAVATYLLFGFNILSIGLVTTILSIINLSIFGWSLGMIIVGIIFKFGTRIQAITWGMVYLFQPITAPQYPVSILPPVMQKLAYMLPPTYVFEAIRSGLKHPEIIRWDFFTTSFILNILFFIFSVWLFTVLHDISRITGQFVKNDQQ
jgi:ABC-2 type transport system permease protein